MTEQEIARFELVLKESARIRAEIANEEAENVRRDGRVTHLAVVAPAEVFHLTSFAA